MRIIDKRSYLVYAERSGDAPLTLYLLDTAGKTVRTIDVPISGGAVVTVPVGQTVEFNSADGQKPSIAKINGADVNTAALGGIGNGGYILTTHPSAGDFVSFTQ